MALKIYHSVNEGLYLWDGTSGLLIDGLHKGESVGCSSTPEIYIKRMRAKESFFARDNDLLITHPHPDHYDQELVREFVKLNPNAKVYGPGIEESNVSPEIVGKGIAGLKIGAYDIEAFETVHDGEQYASVPHEAFLIESCGMNLWLSGDALNEPKLAQKIAGHLNGKTIDIAFVNIYQIARSAGIQFLDILKPKRIILYHLPYEKDDTNHYRRMSVRRVERLQSKGYAIDIIESDRFVKL